MRETYSSAASSAWVSNHKQGVIFCMRLFLHWRIHLQYASELSIGNRAPNVKNKFSNFRGSAQAGSVGGDLRRMGVLVFCLGSKEAIDGHFGALELHAEVLIEIGGGDRFEELDQARIGILER